MDRMWSSAVYGTLIEDPGGARVWLCRTVTNELQQILDRIASGIVTINNENLTYRDDLVERKEKHFAAIVRYPDRGKECTRPFACQEGQTLNFSAPETMGRPVCIHLNWCRSRPWI